jgi:dTDP-4-amino-4,6-dideoxygalactose transaminase
MNVPWLDLKAQHAGLEAEMDAALKRVCRSAQFALGPEVEEFERQWADYCDAEHCVALSSGTAALHVALEALGVGEGDEVVTSPMSFFATAEALLYVGARPVFADVDPLTGCLAPEGLEELVGERTRAVMPVHLGGHPADMDPILELAEARGLVVIEDACQAHGALYKGRKVGALGHAGAFSFYPSKNLSACGDAGALVTNDAEVAKRARLLRNHGQDGPYMHALVGHNYRMDGFQGALLQVKLARLDEWTERRRRLAERYAEALAGTAAEPAQEAEWARCVWHLYAVQCDRRDELQEHLKRAGVATGVHYPTPIPELEAMQGVDVGLPAGGLPRAKRRAGRALSIPLFPEMTDEQFDYVVERIREFR